MKKLALLLMLAVIGLAALAFLKPELVQQLRNTLDPKSSTLVYKWQDKEGNWHVTNTRPQAGIPYEEQEYLHSENVLPAVIKDDK